MYLDAAQFPCPVSLEFDFEMNSCQITRILRCVGLATVPVLLRCFAEAPRKEHMPKQRMPSQSPSPRQTNVAKEKPKMKASESPKGRMKTNHNQKPRKKRSGTAGWLLSLDFLDFFVFYYFNLLINYYFLLINIISNLIITFILNYIKLIILNLNILILNQII